MSLLAVVALISLVWGPGSGLAAAVLPSSIPTVERGASAASAPASAVRLVDDAAGRQMFDHPSIRPGEVTEDCVVVTYSGAHLPSDVFLDASVSDTGLEDHLAVTVEGGLGGRLGDCTGFAPTSVAFSGTLRELGERTSARPLVVWSPAAAPESLTFRFVVVLDADSDIQGTSASASFMWEARSR